MSSRRWSGTDIQQRARDILDSIEAIRLFISGMEQSDFDSDRKTRSAVDYELLTISEAAARIRDMEEAAGTPEPDRIASVYDRWATVCAIANRLRHEYGRIDNDVIWGIVAGPNLHELAAAIRKHFSITSTPRSPDE